MMEVVAREPATKVMEVRVLVVHDSVLGVDRMSTLIECVRHTKFNRFSE